MNDEPQVGDTILAQLQAYEKTIQLGCIFTISKAGTSIWLSCSAPSGVPGVWELWGTKVSFGDGETREYIFLRLVS